MTNSRDRAVSNLHTIENLRRELREEYADPNKRRASHLSRLHGDLGVALKLAHIHAQLATAEAVADLGSDLFTALRARADVILDAAAAADMARS